MCHIRSNKTDLNAYFQNFNLKETLIGPTSNLRQIASRSLGEIAFLQRVSFFKSNLLIYFLASEGEY